VARHVEFGAVAEMDADERDAARIGMRERLSILSPEEEQAYLQDAGFNGVTQFYHAFSFRGWVAYA
jgi:tRNA (cmo5U34)-methyltransferase